MGARPIESIRVGERVITDVDSPRGRLQPLKTAVDRKTWRLLRLHAEDRWADSTLDAIEVETLQPPTWVAANKPSRVRVPVPLDLVEMGLPADLRAEAVANETCPPVRGDGAALS